MAIIKDTPDQLTIDSLRWQFPDQMVSDAEKKTDGWWKTNMDYWHTKALAQFKHNEKVTENYKLLKGFLTKKDFYQEEKHRMASGQVLDMLEELESELDLPQYVKHYSIMGNPINTMIGEMSKRPDNVYVRALDDDSRSERLDAMTTLYQQYMHQKIRNRVISKMQAQGQDTSQLEAQGDEIEQVTEEQLKEFNTSYTSIAEKWGSKMLDALKVKMGMKEKSEEAFRDLLVTSSEYFHIVEDNSKIGFDVKTENKRNVWKLMTDNKKYTRDSYAAGTIHLLELSEILELYPDLPKEEVDHLILQNKQQYLPYYTSPLVNGKAQTGVDSIKFATYDPAILLQRQLLEASIMEDALDEELGVSSRASAFGEKFVVIKAYWKSKKQMGKLTYLDEDGVPQITNVDETYKKIPEEISIEWGYINQWYEGLKIGDQIYHVKPYELLDYCPIIGVEHENKNTPVASLVDMMKPFQMLFNVCMNQLWHQLETEIGPVFIMSKRHIPASRDGDNQDAIDEWEAEARERGVIFVDDSPENTKSPSSFNQYRAEDLSKSQQMSARRELAGWCKEICWELVGISRQRAASTTSSETATSINTALTQSYAQTEPLFVQHEYLCNQLYQAMLDAAMYVETNKPESTIQSITDGSFITVNRDEILLRDLHVYVESRAKDQQIFQKLQDMAQPMLQNGADFTLIAEMFTTTSVRQLQDSIKIFQQKKDEMMNRDSQQKQQQLEQDQQQFEAQTKMLQDQHQADIENENYNKDLDRINKKEIAVISALGYGKETGEDLNQNGVPDLYEMEGLRQKQQQIEQTHQIALNQQQLARQQHLSDNALKQQQIELQKEKLKVEQARTQSQERIAKHKATEAAKKKATTPKKK